MTPEAVASSTVLALNQGLYNSFLAAGLFWGLMMRRVDIKGILLVLCHRGRCVWRDYSEG